MIISIHDRSKVYFGDYHHVRLTIEGFYGNAADESSGDLEDHLPVYTRVLEKMGVPAAEVENVRQALLTDFRQNALPYIAAADFPDKMLKNKRSEKKCPFRRYEGQIFKCR